LSDRPLPWAWGDVVDSNAPRSERIRVLPRRLAFRALNSGCWHLSFRMVRDNYYSPLVDLDSVPREQQLSTMAGVAWEPADQLRYLTDDLGPYLTELQIAEHGGPDELHLRNLAYEALDLETLYAILRHRRPARVLEIGSGFTTRVIAAALAANGGGVHQVVDPFAAPELDDLASVSRRSGADITDAEFANLSAGDVLFVDSTHVVKQGSEVNRVVLEALPLLAPGVAVHFHDVFLPWDYPFGYFVYNRMFINEQYLLQAFLAMNPAYTVLLATHAIGRLYPQEIAALVPSVRGGASPCAFWIERTS
jgi:hypothetical protein